LPELEPAKTALIPEAISLTKSRNAKKIRIHATMMDGIKQHVVLV
jgi:hypothetical protein